MKATKGVLLINIGTPNSTSNGDVGRYLREFLMDEEILPIPAFFRWILVNIGIVPRRASASAKKYRSIWTSEGSPLMVHSLGLQKNLQHALGSDDYQVEIGMRYGDPSIATALNKFKSQGIEDLYVLPLYPQYCRATTESSFKKVDEMIAKHNHSFRVKKAPAFWMQKEFNQAVAEETKKHLQGKKIDYYLMTYHGLPQSQNNKMEAGNTYQEQCFKNSELIAKELGLSKDQWGVSFQSRVGVETWIKPYTDEELKALPGRGVKDLAVLCPSFVADCLETIEEIGMEGSETFKHAGGENFYLVPCLNDRVDYLLPQFSPAIK
ncbi:ferrochelatase [Bdellovibrio sp. HCB337]|uniref:ferrochelatase n=1 Tax=Bdellovibrio sp. HCB337 TaxID=3394358 RepID=UPI0039A54CD4